MEEQHSGDCEAAVPSSALMCGIAELRSLTARGYRRPVRTSGAAPVAQTSRPSKNVCERTAVVMPTAASTAHNAAGGIRRRHSTHGAASTTLRFHAPAVRVQREHSEYDGDARRRRIQERDVGSFSTPTDDRDRSRPLLRCNTARSPCTRQNPSGPVTEESLLHCRVCEHESEEVLTRKARCLNTGLTVHEEEGIPRTVDDDQTEE